MPSDEVSDESLADRFRNAEVVIDDLQSGKFAEKDLMKRLLDAKTTLEELTRDVSSLGLFSTNEMIEELPSSTLPFMLIPCYLGQIHQSVSCPMTNKSEQLKLSKIYYIDFLKRVKSYGLIDSKIPGTHQDDEVENEDSCRNPFEIRTSTMSPEEIRQAKIARFRMLRDYQDGMLQAKNLYQRSRGTGDGDDELLREQYLKQLQYWTLKLTEEIPMVDKEISIQKMIADRESGPSNSKQLSRPPIKPVDSLKPFIIARSEAQKRVIGLGYPSIPTLTVDQWYDQRFGKHGGPGSMPGPSNAKIHSHGDDEECNSGSEDEDDDEEKRSSKIRYDEYKDTHRRGWGNTHNKG